MKFNRFFNEFDRRLPISVVNGIKMVEDTAASNMVSSAVYQAKSTLTAEVINTTEAKKYAIDRDYLKTVLGLKEISKDGTPEAYNYLIGRCQNDMTRFLYSNEYQ